jgi:hypothetical protein
MPTRAKPSRPICLKQPFHSARTYTLSPDLYLKALRGYLGRTANPQRFHEKFSLNPGLKPPNIAIIVAKDLKPNQAAFDIGKMAHRMAEGYYMHLAAIQVARDPRAVALSPNVEPGQIVPVGYVFRKDDIAHVFHFTHYLGRAGSDPDTFDDLNRLWLVGALLAVGDALSRHGYFDHAPELELLRHLRNGVAHGNTFRIDPKRLAKFPANNRLAWIRGDNKAEFEITPNLQNQPVLFDFMAPGNILDLLMSVSHYLEQMRNDESAGGN